jgi:hypothetical protein
VYLIGIRDRLFDFTQVAGKEIRVPQLNVLLAARP